MVYVEKVDNKQAIKMRSRVGSRKPIYSTAVGKAIRAYLPEDETLSIPRNIPLEPLTKNTITDLDRLNENLHQTRYRGYAIDDEGNEVGIRCVEAPIFGHEGRVVAALSISGGKFELEQSGICELECRYQVIHRRVVANVLIDRVSGKTVSSPDIPASKTVKR